MANPAEQDAPSQSQPPEDGTWGGVEENIGDPEEMRVIFSALDSFSYVLC